MGSPYLSSNESIILSTNDIVVNTVPAEAILTNERLMLVDTRHADIRPQDIPFQSIETVVIGESGTEDPMLSLSLITGPGVTQALTMVFPQAPRMKRVAERDEWAARLKELSIVSARASSGSREMEILPPWVPGPLPEEGEASPAAVANGATAGSAVSHAPLAPRRTKGSAARGNRTTIAIATIVVVVIAVAAVAYLVGPSMFGKGGTAVPTPAPATIPTTIPTPVPTTLSTPPATPVVPVTPQVLIPQTGVFVQVLYDGAYSGSAGAPERMTDVSNTGNTVHQLAVKDETIYATVQKQDNSGKKLTVEIYNNGRLIQSGSVTAPMGTVALSIDLRTA